MKRPSSAPLSYLQQLAAPLPHPAALLHARRPVARGAGSLLDAIPPIVGSVQTFAGHIGASDPPAEASSPRNASPQTPHVAPLTVRSTGIFPVVQRETNSPQVATDSAPAGPAAASSHAEDLPQAAAASRTPRDSSPPNRDLASQPSTRSQPELAPRHAGVSLRPALAELAPPLAGPSSVRHDVESNRIHDRSTRDQSRRGVQVHIGTIEVRLAAPNPAPSQSAAAHRRDPIPSHAGRPAQAEPLSRGLAWSHGLVQG